jgi:hypothetical protein
MVSGNSNPNSSLLASPHASITMPGIKMKATSPPKLNPHAIAATTPARGPARPRQAIRTAGKDPQKLNAKMTATKLSHLHQGRMLRIVDDCRRLHEKCAALPSPTAPRQTYFFIL